MTAPRQSRRPRPSPRHRPRPLPLVAAWAVVAGAVLAAGGAWACVPQPTISLLPRSSGPPGGQLTVEGAQFEQRLELRWNAVDGPLLGAPPTTTFSMPIVIPDVADGLYVLFALERSPGGALGNVVRAPVQVLREGSSSTTTTAASENDDASSSASTFAVVLAIAAGVVLLAGGAIAGAGMARRKATQTDAPAKGDPS